MILPTAFHITGLETLVVAGVAAILLLVLVRLRRWADARYLVAATGLARQYSTQGQQQVPSAEHHRMSLGYASLSVVLGNCSWARLGDLAVTWQWHAMLLVLMQEPAL